MSSSLSCAMSRDVGDHAPPFFSISWLSELSSAPQTTVPHHHYATIMCMYSHYKKLEWIWKEEAKKWENTHLLLSPHTPTYSKDLCNSNVTLPPKTILPIFNIAKSLFLSIIGSSTWWKKLQVEEPLLARRRLCYLKNNVFTIYLPLHIVF